MNSHSTTVAVQQRQEPVRLGAMRRGAKSVGVVCIAAALVGALSLPAAAFSQQSAQVSELELASVIAENQQTVAVSGGVRADQIAREGISATTQEELDELRRVAAEAEARRQAELAAAREAAAEVAAANSTDNAEEPGGNASSNSGNASSSRAAAPAAASVPANGSIVSIARSQLGAPYVWGGSSPSTGFDCSGFTMWVYRQAGYSIPHASGAQGNYGTGVPASQVAPGDLLVWSGHVAIYAGSGQIIHAATSGKPVKYSSYSAMVAAFGTPEVRRFG